ncbi:hypothetical protein M409DRAFT_55448 [Zasmidium cellare ATCC 36951]|uniref:Uncharacterized protein n=1 Tax=Zasmidium cellare ATCC 36951 TaxID=1080233 RepID=A0A6A6CL05_ZASCE|nr:uncharacterized protein M409DRAFT_55448 [Zasmidium cellare ATCC 36951]KAF2166106.1 hypothetical protein M409DRAFT_55448 [Zasmidium cellare ATCC 36951]
MRLRCLVALSLCMYLGAVGALNGTVEYLNVSTPSEPSAFGATHGIGDYVAAGIGIESTTTTSSRIINATARSSPHTQALSTGLSGSNDASVVQHRNATSTQAILGLSQCWDQWSTYWDKLPSFSTHLETACVSTSEVMTYASTIFYTMTRADVTPYTSLTTWTGTATIDNNGFAVSTYYKIETWTIKNTRSAKGTTYTSAASVLYTYVETCDRAYSTTASARQPNCTLPSTSLPQCQTSWDSWLSTQLSPIEGTKTSNVSAGPAPSCTQASIAEKTCVSLKDAFVSSSLDLSYFSKILPSNITPDGRPEHHVHWSGGYYSWRAGDWNWPPSTAFFAPSCTLGCGRCSIKGGTVDLLYWPPATTKTIGANDSAPTTTNDNFVITTLGTTLTSPTLYISYRSLYAEDACGKKIGTTIYDTILAIPAESTLQSIWGSVGSVDEYQTTDVYTSTASFNVSDLYQDPVPMSIYSSQPWCAKWAYFYLWNNFTSTSWHCPHTEAYKPIIKVPEDVLKKVDPLWADCVEAYGGVYDPPLALRPASTAAGVTVPNQPDSMTTPAAQASTPLPMVAPSTTAVRAESPNPKEPSVPAQPQPTADDSPSESPAESQDEEHDSTPQEQIPGTQPTSLDDSVLQEAIESAVAAVQAEQPQETPPSPTVATTSPEVLTIASQTFTHVQADAHAVVFADAGTSFSIQAGGDPVTVGSNLVSAIRSNELVVGAGDAASTLTLEPAGGTSQPRVEVTVGSEIFSVEVGSANVFFNEESTFRLEAGVATQIGSNVVSAVPGGGAIVVDAAGGPTTIPLPIIGTSNIDSDAGVNGAEFEISGESYTAIKTSGSDGKVVVAQGSSALTIDGTATSINGQALTVASEGVVVNGVTHSWTSAGIVSSPDVSSSRSSTAAASRQTTKPVASGDQTAIPEGTSPPGPTSTSGATDHQLRLL